MEKEENKAKSAKVETGEIMTVSGSSMVGSFTNGPVTKTSGSLQATKSNGKFQQSQTNSNSHQFRAPENSVTRNYKRAGGNHTVNSSSGSHKKSKAWNKRQHRGNNMNNGGNKSANSSNPMGTGISTTANLENIQDSRGSNALGTVVKNNRYHHPHESGGGESRPINGQRLALSLQRKSLSHRSNHLQQQQHKIHKIIGSALCNGSNVKDNLSDNSGRLKDPTILGVNNKGSALVNGKATAHFKNHCCLRSKFFLADNRPRKDNFIPPTKFLLGGNISDPLNLNSLQNETGDASSNDDGDSSGRTPRRSPFTTPPKVEVIIPPNIHDPLHLLDPVDSVEYEKQLTSPMKKEASFAQLGGNGASFGGSGAVGGVGGSKHRHRKNRKMKRRRNESQNNYGGSAGDDQAPLSGLKAVEDNTLLMAGDKPSQPQTLQGQQKENESLSMILEETDDPQVSERETQLELRGGERKSDEVSLATAADQPKGNDGGKLVDGRNGEYPVNGIFSRKRKISEGHSNASSKVKKFRIDAKDRIVSPVVPQPGTWKRPLHTVSSYKDTVQNKFTKDSKMISGKSFTELNKSHVIKANERPIEDAGKAIEDVKITKTTDNAGAERLMESGIEKKSEGCPKVLPQFKKKDAQYRYGNYNRYVDVRHVNESMDVRLQVFHRFPELFTNKDILDIGCNVGCMTMCIAKRFAPKSILGIDIDKKLIDQARRNLSLSVRIPEVTSTGRHRNNSNGYANRSIQPTQLFPISFPISLGGIPEGVSGGVDGGEKKKKNPSSQARGNTYPQNVSFRCCNYVVKDESMLTHDTQQYDLILCLSMTKWMHLNFGDAGLKLAFKRMFNQLRPGGKLILEAQNWTSYKKKKKLNETVYNNFNNIEFFPKKFREYLLSSEVGFSHSYTLGVPKHMKKGFCRPIQLYAKGDYTPNHVRWSDAYCPQTPFEAYRGIYAMQPPSQGGGGGGGGAGTGCGGGWSSHLNSSIRSQNYETPHHVGASGTYSSHQTPLHHGNSQNTLQYYNPLETDSYLPSYDIDYLNSMYVFASPLYQTVWSPPASMRTGSAGQTPRRGGSVHDPEWTSEGGHVYLPNEDNAFSSPNVNVVNAFNSIRETEQEAEEVGPTATQQRKHVYPPNYEEQSPYSSTAYVADEAFYLDDDLRDMNGRNCNEADQETDDSGRGHGHRQQTPSNN